jgi:hypothetical protein
MAHRRLQAIRHFALQGLRRKNRSDPCPVLSGKLFHTTATNWGKSNSCRPLPRSSPSQNLTRKPVFKSVGGRGSCVSGSLPQRGSLCCRAVASRTWNSRLEPHPPALHDVHGLFLAEACNRVCHSCTISRHSGVLVLLFTARCLRILL